MNPERYKQVDQILQQALSQPPASLKSFLKEACAGDEDLRREVESLIEHDRQAGDFIASPAAGSIAADQAEESHPNFIGRTLLHYHILEKIGEGGMGVVYRAEDSHLKRSVAIKLLPPDRMADPERKKRFMHEARAASALNHPNIITIYDISNADGIDFIAMEYVAGKPLAQLIGEKGLSLQEALKCAIQVADALEKAHKEGIVHRDLKPSNIMVTEDGLVKILDFGLAKLTHPSQEEVSGLAQSSESLTQSGAIVGTVAYMSPEQAEGKPVDARSDIFTFGAVLYEMVTGRRAFKGDSNISTLAAVLHEEPEPLSRLVGGIPLELERIIGKCLEKEPDSRYQSAKELAIDLRRLLTPSAVKVAEVPVAGRRLWKVLVPAAVILVAAAIGGTLYFRSRRTVTRLTDKDTIVLSDFNNKTGDSVFDDTLKQGLSVQLEQSPFLDLVSDQKVNNTLKLMGRPVGDRLTPEVTREVCQRTGSKAMVTGSIAGLGSQYVIGLKAVTCDTGDVLAEAQEQAAGKEAVLKALDAAAVRLRTKLGESLGSVQKYATPLQEVTTASLEALKSYSVGRRMADTKGLTVALPFYQRAVELDPNFARAYSSISVVYSFFNEGRAAENARKAYDLREKVSERERLGIEGWYYGSVGELEKQAQTCELEEQTYPRDYLPHLALGGISGALGNWERTLEEWREALRLVPAASVNYSNLGFAYTVLNRPDEAEAVFKQGEERGLLKNEDLLWYRYLLAFLKGDTGQMARLVSAAMGNPGAEGLLAAQADTEAWYGKLKSAHELTGRAMDSARRNDAKEWAAAYQAVAALREVEAGNREQARAEAKAALKLAPNRDVRAMAALALARAGDAAGAEKLAAELDKTYPLDTLVHRYWLPTIRAGVALERKDPNGAIELLKTVSPIELGQATNFINSWLCPIYVRGEAYLMLRDGDRGAAEFQKFIDHRGVVMNFPWGALARLGLARAYAMERNTAKARAAYQDFLTLWKDADPDLPILKKAKSEYSKLQ